MIILIFLYPRTQQHDYVGTASDTKADITEARAVIVSQQRLSLYRFRSDQYAVLFKRSPMMVFFCSARVHVFHLMPYLFDV